MSTLARDVRYALRMLLRSRGFTTVAVLTLALGIGANTAIFSIVYTVLLKPLPYEHPEQLMALWANTGRARGGAASPADFIDYRRLTTSFEDLAALQRTHLTLSGTGDAVRLPGARVSDSLFGILRVSPALGRTFTADEDRAGAPPVVVLSHGSWQTRFGGDRRILGRTVTLDGTPHTVIGVMPAGFDFPRLLTNQPVEFWVPLALDQARASRGAHYLAIVGRLGPGTTMAAAQAELDTVSAQLQRQYPDTNTNWLVNVFSLHDEMVGDTRTALLMLVGAVMFVLLIACANVANLLLARAASRARELAVRAALGAGSGRLVRQLLTESLVLALAGAVLGVFLAAWGLELASSLTEAWLPRAWEIGINGPVLFFTLAAALLTGIVFGLVPGLHVTRGELSETLKSGGRTTGSGGHQRLRTALVVSEVALAFVLLIGAGLLIRSFHQLQNVRPGFEPDRMFTGVLSLPETRYETLPAQATFVSQLLSRTRALPQVRSAALTSFLPLDGKDAMLVFSVEGEPEPPPASRRIAQWRVVSDGFFETMSVPVIKGRTFVPSDTAAAPRVAVVSRSLAQRYFPTTDPIGQRVTLDDPTDAERQWFTIVGVVDDVRFSALTQPPRPLLYYPVSQQQFPEFALVARTSADPMAMAAGLRTIVRSIDPLMPLTDVRSMGAVVSSSIAGARFRTSLLVTFSLIALMLSAIGVYGVMSYSVEQRTQEMGLRMALGASPGDVLRLVTEHGMRLAVAGIVLGGLAAYWLSRLLESLLFGISTNDPLTFAAIAVLLATVASVACYIPARRATRTDPMVVLRAE